MSRMFLFDTSVWIDFLNNRSSPAVVLLEEVIFANMEVFLTPTILQEILQGIRDDAKYRRIKETLSYFHMLDLPSVQAAEGAADLYRALRKKGATIRKSNDCLIAYYAITYKMTLVHHDTDFDQIALHTELKIWNFEP